MLRTIVATGLAVLGTNLAGTGPAGEAGKPPAIAFSTIARAADVPCARDAMTERLANIAARAAAPKPGPAELTQRDQMALYLLLAMRGAPQTIAR